jgi:hypothetical protein
MYSVFLLSITLAFADQPPSEDAMRRAQAVATEKIPRLHLEGTTFDETLTIIRSAWEERHPNESLPVAVTDYEAPEGYREKNVAYITLDLKNLTFIEALQYIGDLSGRRLRTVRGLVHLEGKSWIEEDWETRVHDISPAALAALRLKANSSDADVRRAFQQFGVKFDDWMNLHLIDSARQVVIRSYKPQQEQIAGIIFLLGNGFRIAR